MFSLSERDMAEKTCSMLKLFLILTVALIVRYVFGAQAVLCRNSIRVAGIIGRKAYLGEE